MCTNGQSITHEYEKVPIKEIVNENEEPAPYGYGVRHVQSLLVFMCLSVAFIARAHLGVSIVAMVDNPSQENLTNLENVTRNKTEALNNTNTEIIQKKILDLLTDDYHSDLNNSDIESVYENQYDYLTSNTEPADANSSLSMWNVYRSYNWPKSTQELVLGSFFLGYLIMTFPMGLVCQRWGGKVPLQIALSINGIVSILSPWFVTWGGWKAACFCRILQGLSQAGIYPGTITMLAEWVPQSERGSLGTYVFTGTVVGTVVAFQVGGFLAATSWGWPSIFWFTGVMCMFAFALMTIFGTSTPREHKFISEAERNFILGHNKSIQAAKSRKTPWKAIFTSKHVWAIFATHIGSGTSFVFFFSQVPTYLHNILGLNIRESGLLSSLPYIANFVTSIIMGYLSDYCTNRKILSVKFGRIMFNSIAAVGFSLCLIAVSFIHSTEAAIACLILALSAHAGVHAGWVINYIDLSPNYSATMVSAGNTGMNLFLLSMPVLVSNIVTDVTNRYQWRIVLLLVAGLLFVTNVIFVTFMSSELQPWNDGHHDDAVDKEAKETVTLKESKEQNDDVLG